MSRLTRFFFAFAVLLVVVPALAQAQSSLPDPGALASQNLRGYTHMFIAYFIAWAVIFGWVVSIARRLGRVEKALKE
jgi:CcmD family protein